ncbi:MFS transporter [Pseudomonas sp. DTU_2021_1001937_2_SI_NGA_ILE_001]|uniref:MFS transporter n=1 Tax=Pseudomonas sp. DTU_2021_1001937_2_SI_NGA_ILE_001 TaxID=3077589 RepID=UPI0028FC125B|nr:MFS transporter [Pseudomonas sp. DTU_2021_1001937_2_SI_NGA_ILE_001]WNW10060.1 MFS transporter [Pseudomonas sp. DTU_2021_1001937_2_SI_NGA_ILE_001]
MPAPSQDPASQFPSSADTSRTSSNVTLQIVGIVLYTFIAFLCIGLPLAILPGYIHDQLGFSAVVAGLAIGAQYLATLLSRPLAGRVTDTLGSKRSIIYGLCGFVSGGALTLFGTLLAPWPLLSLMLLIVARLIMGVSQGMIGVGTISWSIAKVGVEHTARSISWNGIASYGAIALGAPLGVLMIDYLGFHSLGLALMLLAGGGLLLVRHKPAAAVIKGERLPYWSVFGRVSPYGLALTLASIGYGTLTTFITLFYASRGWEGAAWCLTLFGLCFILSRLLFINAIKRLGGFLAAISCMAVEVVGLALLWLAPNTGFALVGAGLTGFGLSLVYPALGVEAIKRVPAASRSAGLAAYAVFFDLAMAFAGPVMGAIALGQGYAMIFFYSALLAALGFALTFWLSRRPQPAADRSTS